MSCVCCVQVTRVGTGFFGEYFEVDSEGNMRRECAARRSLIQEHVDSAASLREWVYESISKPAAADGTRRWNVLTGQFDNGLGGLTCEGVSECRSATGVCGCTNVPQTKFEDFVAPFITPATLALDYARTIGGQLVTRNKFMSAGSLNINLELSLVKYSVLDLDSSGKIMLDNIFPESLVETVRAQFGNVFRDLDAISQCSRIDMLNPTQASGWKPLYNTEIEDPVAVDMIAQLGGDTLHRNMKARDTSVFTIYDTRRVEDPPKVGCSGVDCSKGLWLEHTKDLMNRNVGWNSCLACGGGSGKLYKSASNNGAIWVTDGKHKWPYGNCEGKIDYEWSYGEELGWDGEQVWYAHDYPGGVGQTNPIQGWVRRPLWIRCPGDRGLDHEPALGTMVHYLEHTGLAIRGIQKGVQDEYNTDPGVGNPDSYCGMLPSNTLRTDLCGRTPERQLDGCSQTGGDLYVGPMTNQRRRQDPRGRQTCVFSHSCPLSAYSGLSQTLQGEDRLTKTEVFLMPGTEIMGGYRGPGGEGRDIYAANLINVNEIWIIHSNAKQWTDWVLPIGMWLETYTSPFTWTLGSHFSNPFYQDYMWPMCPHVASTFGTDAIDASKSRLLESYAGTDKTSYQTEVQGSSTRCPASLFSYGECRTTGWMSYRVGFADGYTMNPLTCAANTMAFMVQRNVFRCLDVTLWQINYCEGTHECMYRIPAAKHPAWSNAKYISDIDKAFFRGTGDKQSFYAWDRTGLTNLYRRGFSDEAATRGAILALMNRILEAESGSGQTYTAVPSMPLYDSEAALWNGANPFTEYNANRDEVCCLVYTPSIHNLSISLSVYPSLCLSISE